MKSASKPGRAPSRHGSLFSGGILRAGISSIILSACLLMGEPIASVSTAPVVSISPVSVCLNSVISRNPLTLTGQAGASSQRTVTSVTWSTSGGASGSAAGINPWTASDIPLQPGQTTITVSAMDSFGETGTASLDVQFSPSPGTIFVDCSAATSGDGSHANPLNDLQAAADFASSGDTIAIIGGPCHQAISLVRGVALEGDPALPHVVIDGTVACGGSVSQGYPLELDTPEPVILRRLTARTALGNQVGGSLVNVALEDVVGSEFFVRGLDYCASSPEGIHMTDSAASTLEFFAFCGILDIQQSADIALAFYGTTGPRGVRVSDSSLTRLSKFQDGPIPIALERTLVTGPVLFQYNGSEGQSVQFSASDSVFLNAPITVYSINGTKDFTFRRTRFGSSPIQITVYQEAISRPGLSNHFLFADSVFRDSPVSLNLGNADPINQSQVSFSGINNTILEAPIAVSLRLESAAQPDWELRLINNLIVGGDVGIDVNGLELVQSAISGNNVFGQAVSRYAGDLADQTGMGGNVSVDPLFANLPGGDYSLQTGSPCIDAGVASPYVSDIDFAGNPRILDGDADGQALPDVGAFEFAPDHDADGYNILGDCDDEDALVWSTPGEVRNLVFADSERMEWDRPLQPGGLFAFYDTIRSDYPHDFLGGASCIESDDALDARASDGSAPPPGGVYFYLVRAENLCPSGQGPLGYGSDEVAIPGRSCP